MNDYSEIEVEIDDPVALIRLNRPDTLNALTFNTLREIRHAITAAAEDPRVVGIVITGNGRGFCSGLDASVLVEVTQSEQPLENTPADSDAVAGMFTWLLEIPKPVICAVNGVAAGGGLVLTLMSDIRIASTAAAFTTVFLKRGLMAEHGTTWILPRLMGTGKALDLLWMSDKINAEEALQLGLVDKLAEPEALVETACDYIRRLAATSPPAAIAETKRLVYRHLNMDYASALRETEIIQNAFVARSDAAEGANAFMERRAPNFKRLGEEQ
jgi:enoyl-CoA hydratase/carnithine racemase